MIAKGNMNGDSANYSLQSEAHRIFKLTLEDSRLNVPSEVKALRDHIQFVGEETEPFYPVPYKAAESQAGLLGLTGLFALAIAKNRYGIEQRINIDVSHALLNGLGALFMRHEGEWLSGSPKMMAAVQRWDHGQTRELYRQLATNIYKSKDERWYSLHGNMNPTPLLEMLNVPQHNEKNLSWPQILDMYAEIVGKIDSKTLDDWSNNVYRTPGTVCLEKEEFENSPHVRYMTLTPTGYLILTATRGKLFEMSRTTICYLNRIIHSQLYLGPAYHLTLLTAGRCLGSKCWISHELSQHQRLVEFALLWVLPSSECPAPLILNCLLL